MARACLDVLHEAPVIDVETWVPCRRMKAGVVDEGRCVLIPVTCLHGEFDTPDVAAMNTMAGCLQGRCIWTTEHADNQIIV